MVTVIADPPGTRRLPVWLFPLLSVLFFTSGAAALTYQVLWLRLLGLIFGVTVYAASTVLAVFMCGLAIGSEVAGRIARRARRPLACFGAAEILIGIFGVLTPAALAGTGSLYAFVHPYLPDATWPLTAARLVCAFLVLIVPTCLMGASLPFVIRSALVSSESGALGHNAAFLYAVNTAGAVVGALGTGFYLIGGLGISDTTRLAASLNVLVGLAAVLASRALPEFTPAPSVPSDGMTTGGATSARRRVAVLVALGISGFGALALEILWFRLLVLFVAATTYAFTTMLATVLLGIAAGSAVVTPLMRRGWNWMLVLAGLEAAVAFATLGSFAFAASEASGSMVRASLHAALLPTVFMGMAFPVGLRLWAAGADAAESARRVATLYAVNVCGAILGSLVAGFLLLPWIGLRSGVIAVAALFLVAAWLLAWVSRPRRAALAAIAMWSAAFALADSFPADPFSAVIGRRYPGNERLFFRDEGVQTTVTIHMRPRGEPTGRVLYLDGLHQADDSADMVRVHRQIGHLAMALHPSPVDAAVIGLGGGATAGAVATHHGADVDVVELSPGVIRAALWFSHVNGNVPARTNVTFRVDDGRNYLLLSPKSYDVITADIIQPTHAGAGNLYSVEYFRLVRRALRPDGLVLQWIGRREETQYKLIVRTFLHVFPETTLWQDGTLMVGTKRRLVLDRGAFERKIADPGTREALASVELDSFDALLARYTAGPRELQRFVGEGALLTDDRPLVEFHRSLPAGDRLVDLSGLRGDVTRHLVN
ncbi:MAG: fused MFS/spermidine synthase [Acidobacteria bacterium]|nr:fused MFS/spermidine synthase [Acidobacteriota bacterium]